MMITEGVITSLVEEKIRETEMFLVSVRVMPTNRIRVYVDSVKGLSVSDCVAVSRHIEGSLDREKEDFELEVSSPGATEPYQHPKQYEKNIGRTLKVTTNEGKNIKGKLVSFENEAVTIEPEKKKKKEQAEPVTISLTDIKEAKTVISFN